MTRTLGKVCPVFKGLGREKGNRDSIYAATLPRPSRGRGHSSVTATGRVCCVTSHYVSQWFATVWRYLTRNANVVGSIPTAGSGVVSRDIPDGCRGTSRTRLGTSAWPCLVLVGLGRIEGEPGE
jgi:hypothetical protein